jgi:uncharacterized SAM-binding protein YcdF (DUF218 family)
MSGAWLVRFLGWPLARAGRSPKGGVDAIVVLGAPLRPDGSLGAVLAERVKAGVALWARGVAPLLCLTGGRTRGGDVAEAEAMADVALAAGVPRAALVVETASRNTYENARNLAAILRPTGARERTAVAVAVVIVTQPFHLLRARMHFARFGFAAAGFVIEDSLQYRIPRARGLRWMLREYPSLLRDFLWYLK